MCKNNVSYRELFIISNSTCNKLGQLIGIALDYGLYDREFETGQRLVIFLFTTASRPALGPTQPI
jgi:hypothetical protein